MPSYLFIVLIFVVFYFLLIRPQQRRAKEARELQDSLKAGDKVMLTSGILGDVAGITEDNKVQVQVAEGVIITVVRQAIGQVLPEHDETPETDENDASDETAEAAETEVADEAPAEAPGETVELGKSKSKDSSN